jgi:hypothetical protein
MATCNVLKARSTLSRLIEAAVDATVFTVIYGAWPRARHRNNGDQRSETLCIEELFNREIA